MKNVKHDIDVGKLVKGGLGVGISEPSVQVAKAKGKGGKFSPDSIIKNIKG
jgi:hypothetical protein